MNGLKAPCFNLNIPERTFTLTEPYTVSRISLERYGELWQRNRSTLPWHCLFVTPLWLETVASHLGTAGEPLILTVTRDQEVVGIFPFCTDGQSAFFLGIPDVCDYQDVMLAPGHEVGAMERVLSYLSKTGIGRLDLQTLRPDAATLKALAPIDGSKSGRISREPADVTFETRLPGTWEDYLMQLNGKQRHEVRRKLRRLEAHGAYQFRMADTGAKLDGEVDLFLGLFHLNRQDKSQFMDDTMSGYFRALARRLARHGLLRLYFLDVDGQPAAAVLCFDYLGTRYLYNSGYDSAFHELSVGILSKVLSIRAAVENGCGTYDFLKGAEVYKKRIGGREVPLYHCQVAV